MHDLTSFFFKLEKDKQMKICLSVLCFGSLILGVFYPILQAHNTILCFVTNMVWLWET